MQNTEIAPCGAKRVNIEYPPADFPRILIVDDHAITRHGLRQLLTREFANAAFGEAVDADEGLEQFWSHPWDLVLLDITTPAGSGLDLLKRIMTAQPEACVLMLGGHPEDEHGVQSIHAGAAGYLSKTNGPDIIIEAVRAVLSGQHYFSPLLAGALVSAAVEPMETRGREILSRREGEVLRLIGAGRTLKEIAADLSVSAKTVSTYKSRLMRKMRFDHDTQIVRYALLNKLAD